MRPIQQKKLDDCWKIHRLPIFLMQLTIVANGNSNLLPKRNQLACTFCQYNPSGVAAAKFLSKVGFQDYSKKVAMK